MKFPTLVILSAFAVSTQAASSLKVSVYYESLCPDSQKFITTQLYPAYQILSKYLDVEFVPFGHASIDISEEGALNFTCQHGPEECYGNEIQACVLSLDPDHSFEFVDCAMASEDASDHDLLEECAKTSDVAWDSIEECYKSGTGDNLLITYGNTTDALNPDLGNLPGIVFNGVYNPDVSGLAEKNFFDVACVFLENPKECREEF